MSGSHSKTEGEEKALTAKKGASKTREELQAPPYTWISWLVLLSYALATLEGVWVFVNYPWSQALFDMKVDALTIERVKRAQIHLCCIYFFEVLLAVGPKWCAMSPGWTQGELLIHHALYIAADVLCFVGGHETRWTAPMAMVSLTPLNEGLFIACSLGFPAWLQKFRRLYGFAGILALWLCETYIFFGNQFMHWRGGWSATSAFNSLVDQCVLGGIYYHALLLHLYIRRWRKTRTL
jgi:hypothetical protein